MRCQSPTSFSPKRRTCRCPFVDHGALLPGRHRLVRPAIPDEHVAPRRTRRRGCAPRRRCRPSGDPRSARRGGVTVGVVAGPLGHRPAGHRPVDLEPHVVVQPARVVLLDDEGEGGLVPRGRPGGLARRFLFPGRLVLRRSPWLRRDRRSRASPRSVARRALALRFSLVRPARPRFRSWPSELSELPMRAFWSGEIAFGLVTIPAKLYTATKDLTPQFHQLHKECGTRISMVRRCPKCSKDLAWEEIGKGYEVAKGEYALFTKEELAKLDGDETGGTHRDRRVRRPARGRPRVHREELLDRPGQQERARLRPAAQRARRDEEGSARQGAPAHAHAPRARAAARQALLARHDALRRGARAGRRAGARGAEGAERRARSSSRCTSSRSCRARSIRRATRRVPERGARGGRSEGRGGRSGARRVGGGRGPGGRAVHRSAGHRPRGAALAVSIKAAGGPGPKKAKSDDDEDAEQQEKAPKAAKKGKRATG